MLLALFHVCAVSLGLTTFTLLAIGHRLRVASRMLGVLVAAGVAGAAGWVTRELWHLPTSHAIGGEVVVFVVCSVIVLARRDWNPVGQVFYGSLVAASLVYLAFGLDVTFRTGLSPVGMVASALLFVLEAAALSLSAAFGFEACDVACRVRWPREIPAPVPEHRPFVSLQIAAYNEPPDMLIETIRSCEAIDYPSFEVVVVDNNTRDPAVWRPVEAYCRDRPLVRFVHVEAWPGYKAGALNLALRGQTDPRAEIVGVVDADYQVDPTYLSALVGYFADPSVAFVQTPQDYRDFEEDAYLRACYDAYRYFFATTMPSRNQRNSIIFAGTMGLIRRDALVEHGGWDEWCITEDAEASLRMLKRGLQGIYVSRSFGRGIMPLTFSALKSQRFRWCFGGMQILRMHWQDLVPWGRNPDNQLSVGQRIDYLLGGVEWLNDLLYLGFTGTLVASVTVILLSGHLALRPLLGLSVLLPASLIASGMLRALWALRVQTGIGARRAALAFLNWLSLSWTVAIACVQGLVRSEGVFLRTPKAAEGHSAWAAVGAVRTETALALVLWTGAAIMALRPGSAPLLVGLLAWQGFVYASAPVMSWLNSRTVLSPALERRRRTEWMRERLSSVAPYMVGTALALAAVAIVGAVIGFGGSHPGANARNPFVLPRQSRGSQPSPTVSVSPSVTPTPSASGSPVPSPSPSPSPTVTASPSPSGTPLPTPS